MAFSKIVYPAQPPAPVTPTLSAVVSGALAAATYYVVFAYVTADGETMPSAEASLSVAANSVLSIASPPPIDYPFASAGYNVYVGTTPGGEVLQNASPIAQGTDWQEPDSGLIAGAAPTTGWSATSLLFQQPPRFLPYRNYETVRHDNVASSGVYEAIYERTDEFRSFTMEWVTRGDDASAWNDFVRYGLQGGPLSFYEDIQSTTFINCTLWDSKWDAKYKSLGRYTFDIKLRVLFGTGSSDFAGGGTGTGGSTGGGGGTVGTVNFADAEVPSGPINSANAAFTLANAPSPTGSLQLFLNGLEQQQGVDYTLSATTVTFAAAPTTGDRLIAFYRF